MAHEFKLLTRDQFREGVFARDGHKCVICKASGQDAHHILERRLFPDGGYYLENGATLCGTHHIEAEATTLSCETIREAAGIKHVCLPPHLYRDAVYDKWGNIVMPDGRRIRGELMGDESVQKIIAPSVEWMSYVKYPRTYHLPWSPGLTKDDRVLEDISCFEGKQIVVTTKMDGENTSMYRDHIHARSIDSGNHPSRTWVKTLHARIAHDIPEGWRLCGENLYAKHSIHYTDLPSYFMLFSIWNEQNRCLSWDETVEWAQLLDLKIVPVQYAGEWNEEIVRGLHIRGEEGYVVRVRDSFDYRDFRCSVAKYVRAGHVHTHGHWMRERIVPNEMKGQG